MSYVKQAPNMESEYFRHLLVQCGGHSPFDARYRFQTLQDSVLNLHCGFKLGHLDFFQPRFVRQRDILGTCPLRPSPVSYPAWPFPAYHLSNHIDGLFTRALPCGTVINRNLVHSLGNRFRNDCRPSRLGCVCDIFVLDWAAWHIARSFAFRNRA